MSKKNPILISLGGSYLYISDHLYSGLLIPADASLSIEAKNTPIALLYKE